MATYTIKRTDGPHVEEKTFGGADETIAWLKVFEDAETEVEKKKKEDEKMAEEKKEKVAQKANKKKK